MDEWFVERFQPAIQAVSETAGALAENTVTGGVSDYSELDGPMGALIEAWNARPGSGDATV